MNKRRHLEKQAELKKHHLSLIHNKNTEKPQISQKSRAMANKNRSPEKPIYEFLIQKGKEACVK